MKKDKLNKSSIDDLFINPPRKYGGAPFWSWNTMMTQEIIDEQQETFKEMGMGGFHIHVRVGLANDYLSDDFMTFKEAIEEGECPTGYFLCAYDIVLSDGYLKSADLVTVDEEKILGKKWFVYVELEKPTPWYNNQTYSDLLNKEVTDKFIELTHERYSEYLQDDFGSDLVKYANDGTLADITDVFETYATEELKAYLNVDGGLSLKSAMVDGRLYGLPRMGNGYDSVMLMFVRQDWLDRLGLEMPTTMEDLKEVAYAFTYKDPDGNGTDDTYGIALNGVDVFTAMGGVQAIFEGYGAAPGNGPNTTFVLDEAGDVVWGGAEANKMKAGLKLMQEMYEEGSIAREFITMDGNSIFEEASAGTAPGLFNNILMTLHVIDEPIYFIGSNDYFRGTMVLSDIWKGFGFNTIIYLAALTSIDPTLYEAASVDGAGRLRQTWHITLPGIAQFIALMTILSIGSILNAGFEQIFNLYTPAVYESGDIVDTLVYRLGLINKQYSLSAAVGLFKSIVSVVLVTTGYKLADKYTGYRVF